MLNVATYTSKKENILQAITMTNELYFEPNILFLEIQTPYNSSQRSNITLEHRHQRLNMPLGPTSSSLINQVLVLRKS